MRVSVVVNTFNSEKFIEDCLKSLEKQTVKPNEVLVVDHNSKDNTLAIAEKFGCRIIVVEKGKRGFARDVGWRKARGSLVLYADSDNVLSENWVEEILKKFEQGADAVIDSIRVYNPDNYFKKCIDFLYWFRLKNYKPFSAWAFKKSVMQKVGGFKDLWIEEIDLGKRLLKNGFKILHAKKAVRFHAGKPYSFLEMPKRFFLAGKNEYKDIYSVYPESFPTKNMLLFFGFFLLFLTSIMLGLFYPLFFLFSLTLFFLLYLLLFLKFCFTQKACRFIPLKYVLGITFNSFLRAIFLPLGVLFGMLF